MQYVFLQVNGCDLSLRRSLSYVRWFMQQYRQTLVGNAKYPLSTFNEGDLC